MTPLFLLLGLSPEALQCICIACWLQQDLSQSIQILQVHSASIISHWPQLTTKSAVELSRGRREYYNMPSYSVRPYTHMYARAHGSGVMSAERTVISTCYIAQIACCLFQRPANLANIAPRGLGR